MQSGTNFVINILYFVSWIFIGNYMLLNLFLAIMLDSFANIESADHLTREEKDQKAKKRIEDLEKKEGSDLILTVYNLDSIVMEQNTNKKGKSSLIKRKKKRKRSN